MSRGRALLTDLLEQDRDLRTAKELEDQMTLNDQIALLVQLNLDPKNDKVLWMGGKPPEA